MVDTEASNNKKEGLQETSESEEITRQLQEIIRQEAPKNSGETRPEILPSPDEQGVISRIDDLEKRQRELKSKI